MLRIVDLPHPEDRRCDELLVGDVKETLETADSRGPCANVFERSRIEMRTRGQAFDCSTSRTACSRTNE